jgi:hypothetical protein
VSEVAKIEDLNDHTETPGVCPGDGSVLSTQHPHRGSLPTGLI